jgi:hypothetical protein
MASDAWRPTVTPTEKRVSFGILKRVARPAGLQPATLDLEGRGSERSTHPRYRQNRFNFEIPTHRIQVADIMASCSGPNRHGARSLAGRPRLPAGPEDHPCKSLRECARFCAHRSHRTVQNYAGWRGNEGAHHQPDFRRRSAEGATRWRLFGLPFATQRSRVRASRRPPLKSPNKSINTGLNRGSALLARASLNRHQTPPFATFRHPSFT